MEASLHRHDPFIHWSLVINSTSSHSPLPGGWGWEEGWCWKFHSSNPMIGSPAPILRCFPEVTSLTWQRHLYYSQYLGNAQDFKSFLPGSGIKTKYILLINHKITAEFYCQNEKGKMDADGKLAIPAKGDNPGPHRFSRRIKLDMHINIWI